MNEIELKQKIKECIIKELRLERTPESIPDQEPLLNSGVVMDSLDMVSLVWVLEDAFGIKIKDEEMPALNTVERIAEFIKAKQLSA